jgi:hypothetical protein
MTEIIKLKSLQWTLIQYDWHLYEKEKFRHRERHAWGRGQEDVKPYREKMAI